MQCINFWNVMGVAILRVELIPRTYCNNSNLYLVLDEMETEAKFLLFLLRITDLCTLGGVLHVMQNLIQSEVRCIVFL